MNQIKKLKKLNVLTNNGFKVILKEMNSKLDLILEIQKKNDLKISNLR